jgi:hypothetical protein
MRNPEVAGSNAAPATKCEGPGFLIESRPFRVGPIHSRCGEIVVSAASFAGICFLDGVGDAGVLRGTFLAG